MDIGGSLYVDEEGFLEVPSQTAKTSVRTRLSGQSPRCPTFPSGPVSGLIRDKLYD